MVDIYPIKPSPIHLTNCGFFRFKIFNSLLIITFKRNFEEDNEYNYSLKKSF